MSQVAGTTDSYDLVGISEDVEDIIYDLSPTDTPLLSMAKRGKSDAILHQWQTDTLEAAGTNRQIEVTMRRTPPQRRPSCSPTTRRSFARR